MVKIRNEYVEGLMVLRIRGTGRNKKFELFRRYKTREGEWLEKPFFGRNDLISAKILLSEALREVVNE